MNLVVDNRYVVERELLQTDHGSLCKAKDLTLHREVLVYVSPPERQAPDKIATISDLADPRFMHILDGVTVGGHAYLILKSDDGELLLSVLERGEINPVQAISAVIELGKGMQDALEAGISGFSVSVENIWCSPSGKPLFIDSWNQADDRLNGVNGLRLLLIQLLLGERTPPEEEQKLEAVLNKALTREKYKDIPLLLASIRAAGRGQETLSSFLFRLRDLADGQGRTVASMERWQPEPIPVRKKRFTEKPLLSGWRWLAGLSLGGLIAVATLAWFVGHMGMDDPDAMRLTAERAHASAAQRSPSPAPLPTLNESMTASTENVSFGSAPVSQIPDLAGLTKEQAESKAIASGLHYEYFIVDGEGAKGTVFKQSPAAGSSVDKGAKVTFWINR